MLIISNNLDKLLEYKRNWIQHVNRMPRNRLPRIMKHYSPIGRRNHGRPLKRLLDTWDRNGSTSGPTPWQIDRWWWWWWWSSSWWAIISLETCWVVKEQWNNKLSYTVASRWSFLQDLHYDARIHERQISALAVRGIRTHNTYLHGRKQLQRLR